MNHRLAISTISLGWHASHTLERKLAAAAAAGFQGVEMFITDLDGYATTHGITRVQAAEDIKRLCAQRNLEIVCLGSFDNFEGHPTRSLEERLQIAREWIAMADGLGTDVIQVPSNDDKDAVGDIDTVVADLQALADLGLRQESTAIAGLPVKFAYEALGWATHVADWEESLRVVERVARPNFGLCLDTYHVLARLWADPRSPTGRRPGGDAALRMSLETFRARFTDPATTVSSTAQTPIVYVQLSDAERLAPPILPGHAAYSEHQDGVHSWCRYGRLFPLERARGAYLPVLDVARTWLKDSGWTDGWVSMEVFHRDMEREGSGPEHWAERGRRSWEELVKRLDEE
ncbi:uncharacterized protein A1O5_07204 [Cladophialophora psammophila CBS 110553]|uniref:Xylose isomerase-like TIM barrel domain-containing protein n=1 Tax=Cladophialophora psammophila CBS 110553 TaxID=1182543 RepID=W9WZM2_9EURO|nr:uncharacterized protein A1O5_07204 [Cladophialophora psammophila CBS 110553]EXJ70131.1 hypothetical protein A1O5_07204 [Cladophialophora psammophila CBS 110553]